MVIIPPSSFINNATTETNNNESIAESNKFLDFIFWEIK